jgi:hypothetical protein
VFFVSQLSNLTGGASVDVSLSSYVGMIVSSITTLHKHINLKLHTLLSQESCDGLGIPEVISSNGVVESDTPFDNIRFM